MARPTKKSALAPPKREPPPEIKMDEAKNLEVSRAVKERARNVATLIEVGALGSITVVAIERLEEATAEWRKRYAEQQQLRRRK